MSRDRKEKRLILSSSTVLAKKGGEVQIIPTVDSLLDTALGVLQNEIFKIKKKTDEGVRLNPDESQQLNRYIDSLVKLSKETREQAKSEDLKNLTNEEIKQLVESLDQPDPGHIELSKDDEEPIQ